MRPGRRPRGPRRISGRMPWSDGAVRGPGSATLAASACPFRAWSGRQDDLRERERLGQGSLGLRRRRGRDLGLRRNASSTASRADGSRLHPLAQRAVTISSRAPRRASMSSLEGQRCAHRRFSRRCSRSPAASVVQLVDPRREEPDLARRRELPRRRAAMVVEVVETVAVGAVNTPPRRLARPGRPCASSPHLAAPARLPGLGGPRGDRRDRASLRSTRVPSVRAKS